MKEYPEVWNKIISALDNNSLTIPEIAEKSGVDKNILTWHLMTMNRYNVVEPDGLNEKKSYYKYKLKR
jgi:predicted transcriptional regulator